MPIVIDDNESYAPGLELAGSSRFSGIHRDRDKKNNQPACHHALPHVKDEPAALLGGTSCAAGIMAAGIVSLVLVRLLVISWNKKPLFFTRAASIRHIAADNQERRTPYKKPNGLTVFHSERRNNARQSHKCSDCNDCKRD